MTYEDNPYFEGVLEYDGDLHDPKQRCEHGTFIGSWWGPDYLCHWCEDGISVEEMHRIQAANARYRCEQKVAEGTRLLDIIFTTMVEGGHPYDVRLAQNLVNVVLDPFNGYVGAWDMMKANA